MKKLIIAFLLLTNFAVAQQQTINVGTSANDHTGDPLRTALQKTNANFTDLYTNKLHVGTLKTGTTITFDGFHIHNSSSALTGNPTFDFTGAKVGTRVTVRHNDTVAPTMPGTAVYEGGTYRTGFDNYITFTYISNSIVLYRFGSQTPTLLDPIANATPSRGLFVDASGRMNTDEDFKITVSGSNATFQLGQSTTSARFAAKAFTSGGLVASFEDNGGAALFQVDGTNKKTLWGTGGTTNAPFAASTTDGTTINNASRGLLFSSVPAGNNQVGFQFNIAQTPSAGSSSWNQPFKVLYTLTGTNGTGGNPITAKIPAAMIQYAGTLDANYTGDYIGLDVLSTVTVGASPSIFHSRFRSGRLGVNTGTTTPTSTFQVTGSFAPAYVAKTALYTLTDLDHTVEVTSGTHTQTLPTAVGITGRIYCITNSGSGTVTIGTTSSQTFVNVTGTPTTLSVTQFHGYQVQSNGANWIVIASF